MKWTWLAASLQMALILALSTYVKAAAPAASKTAGAMATQGRCACPAKWTYKYNVTSSVTLSGCANPDQDHQGDWCPVSPKCEGLYGNFTRLGETVHFDYCGAVRGITESGCICNPFSDDRDLKAPQKLTYGCANRDASPGIWCNTNNKTCTKPLEYRSELCKTQGALVVENIAPDGSRKTQGGCTCLPNWGYIQEPKYGPLGPFKGCYSGDYDPKGSWCQVDPRECPGAYGSFKKLQPVYFDYCNNVTDFTRAGCRCKPIWGGGKLMDRCANPDGKPQGNWTCTKGAPEGKDWDYCGPGPLKLNATANATSNDNTAGATSNSTDNTLKSVGQAQSGTPVVVLAPAPKSDDKTRRLVVIVVPILTGLAAIVTIMYTLYKCQKKRKFFKSTQIMKMHQYNNASEMAAAGSGVQYPPMGSAQGNSAFASQITKDTV